MRHANLLPLAPTGCFSFSGPTSRHIRSPRGLHIPRKRSEEIKYGTDLIPSFYGWSRGAAVLPLCGCCEWRDGEGTGGWAGRSIIAAEVYISIRMQTM